MNPVPAEAFGTLILCVLIGVAGGMCLGILIGRAFWRQSQ